MELKVKTEELAKLISKAQKAAKIIPDIALTTYLQIESDGTSLSVSGFDGLNYYKFKQKVKAAKALFVLKADIFFKLFSKTTSKEILLKDEESHILFKGNGSYKLDKEIDQSTDEGIRIKFPEAKPKKFYTIKTADFASAMERVFPGVAEVQTPIYLTGILAREDNLLATNDVRSVRVDTKLVKEKILFSVEFTRIVALLESESFKFGTVEADGVKYYVASADDGFVQGSQVLGLKEFPAEIIDGIFETKMEASAKVNKAELIDVVDRFAIFADRIGEQGVEIAVTKDGLVLRKENIGEEIIPLKEMQKFKPYQCRTDILRLKKLIEKADTTDLTFVFGNDQFVIFKYDNAQLLLSTAQEKK